MPADLEKGDWQCSNPDCYNHTNFPEAFVYGSNMNCKKCGTGRTAKKPGDWCCPNPHCINSKNTVYGSKVACPKCGAPKPGSMGAMGGFFVGGMQAPGATPHHPVRQGDWHCPNPACKNHSGNVCYASKSHCTLCGTPKPPPMPSARLARLPIADFAPTPYQQLPPQHRQMPPQRPGIRGGQAGDWNCPNPDCKNHVHNFVYGSKPACPLCGQPKPAVPGRSMGMGAGRPGIPAARPGDWHCPNVDCKNHTGNVVFASKSHCPLCSTPKPEDGGRARSRSPPGGGGEPGDFEDATPMPYVSGFARFGAYGRGK